MDFLGQTWVLSKTVVTIAYSDPYETILEGNQKNVKKIQKSILLCPIIFEEKIFLYPKKCSKKLSNFLDSFYCIQNS